MKNTLILLALLACINLAACDKTPKTSDTAMPEVTEGIDENGEPSKFDEGDIETDPGKSEDEEIKNQPMNPDGDAKIIIPPPSVNMPAEVIPESPSSDTDK
jgi:hypothetical protein